MKKLIAILILILFTLLVFSRADAKSCPDGYADRGSCVKITNCVHGDTLDKYTCAKFDEPEEVAGETKEVKPYRLPPFEVTQGK